MAGKSLIFKLALSGTPLALKYWWGSVYQLGKGDRRKGKKKNRGKGKREKGKRRKREKEKRRIGVKGKNRKEE